MGPSVTAFRPQDPLTRAALARALTALTGVAHTTAQPDRRARMLELDRALVGAAGLLGSARHVLAEARAAGLDPPARFGTEVVARLLGLRYNHPSNRDGLELLPGDPATRAEAAYSFAKLLELSSWTAPSAESTRRRLRPAGAHRLAAASPPPGRLLRRFPLRLGRDVGADAGRASRHVAWRLRLLRLRLEDLPARVLLRARPSSGTCCAGARPPRWPARCPSRHASDGGAAFGPATSSSSRSAAPRPGRATSRTWASTPAAAGSFTRPAKGRR